MAGSVATVRQYLRAHILRHGHKAGEETLGMVWPFETSESTLRHPSSNKATSNLSQMVPPTRSQVFTYMNLWGPFLVKPPHSSMFVPTLLWTPRTQGLCTPQAEIKDMGWENYTKRFHGSRYRTCPGRVSLDSKVWDIKPLEVNPHQ